MLTFEGLERVQATEAGPGDIVLINGIEDIGIGVTITDPDDPQPLPMLKVDEPTLTMNFCVNNSPLAGREGKYVTSRQIWDRLQRELQSNVALKVRETDEDGIFEVMGRGELHLTILLENMRREGYELAVSKPRVVFNEVAGERHEPIELVTADIEDQHQGGVMQALGERKGELVNMEPDGLGRVRLEYRIPGARPDRLPKRVHEPDPRLRPHQQHLRRLRGVQGRDRQPQERRADQPWTTARS